METNTDQIDPLSANLTALATQLESKYTAFRNANRLILRVVPKEDVPEL